MIIKKRQKKISSMTNILLKRIILGNIAIIILGLILISFFVFQFLKNEIGKSRVSLLQQINDVNQVYLDSTENAMNRLCKATEEIILEKSMEGFKLEQAEELMSKARDFFIDMGVDSSVDIVFKNGASYTTDGSTERIEALEGSVRYTYLMNGTYKESWYMNFPKQHSGKEIVLSKAKTIFNKNDETIGFAVISISQKSLYESYENILTDNNVVYIIDAAGIVISHPNEQMIGFTFYHMPSFEQKIMEFNSYKLDNQKKILLSNFHDKQQDWTFIEELDLSDIWKEYSNTLIFAILIMVGSNLVMLLLDYLLIKKITNSLSEFTKDIKNLQWDVDNGLAMIPVQKQYAEIQILMESFNKMLIRMQYLISSIRKHEQQKHKIEYDFLQAQIQPHFLHNTLVALKSLIVMGESDKAVKMMNDFTALLRIPLMNKQFVSLYQEVELVVHYMAIMEYRFKKGFILRLDIPEKLKNILIPRMLLQPIVANAIFHGFVEKKQNGIVTISAKEEKKDLILVISDNGIGMSEDVISQIMSEKQSKNSHHGVGLQNVKSRISLLYGERALFEVESIINVGSQVTIMLPDYDSVREENRSEGEEWEG